MAPSDTGSLAQVLLADRFLRVLRLAIFTRATLVLVFEWRLCVIFVTGFGILRKVLLALFLLFAISVGLTLSRRLAFVIRIAQLRVFTVSQTLCDLNTFSLVLDDLADGFVVLEVLTVNICPALMLLL